MSILAPDNFLDRDKRNMHASREEVDERQALEIGLVLDRWLKGEVDPLAAVNDVTKIIGVRTGYFWEYSHLESNSPGGEHYELMMKAVPIDIVTQRKNIGKDSLEKLSYSRRYVSHIQGEMADPDWWTKKCAAMIEEAQKTLAKQIEEHPHLGKSLSAKADIAGPKAYVDAVKALIALRDKAAEDRHELIRLHMEIDINSLREMRRQREWAAAHIDQMIEKKITKMREHNARVLADARSVITPGVLKNGKKAMAAVQSISQRLESGDLNSWDAAREILRLAIDPEAGRGRHKTVLRAFEEEIDEQEKESGIEKRSIDETLNMFMPQSEAEIKAPLAVQFLKDKRVNYFDRASLVWLKDEEEADAKRPRIYDGFYKTWLQLHQVDAKAAAEFLESYAVRYDAKLHRNDKAITCGGYYASEMEIENEVAPWEPPIDFPDRKLCGEIRIDASGTALIMAYEPGRWDYDGTENLYGTDAARITTYSVSFKPKDPDDLELLYDVVKQALKVLGSTPYPYGLPPDDDAYCRSFDSWQSGYVEIKDGMVVPQARFDLDDLYVLYYILDAIIEPTSQIAAAMNGARYAEERGAVLTPDGYSYDRQEHKVENPLGHMQRGDDDALVNAMRDSLIMHALGQSDEAEFLMQMAVLAHHTLTGQIGDAHLKFPTYPQMIEGGRSEGKGVATYDEALNVRTRDLMAAMIGHSKDSPLPLAVTLMGFVSRLRGPLRDHFREQARRKDESRRDPLLAAIAGLERWQDFEENQVIQDRLAGRGTQRTGDLSESFESDQHEKQGLNILSDMVAGRVRNFNFDEHGDWTLKERDGEPPKDEDGNDEKTGRDLARPGNLVIADSKVETCLDGIYAEGYYMARTAGSPLVRKELPEALKAFAPQAANRPSARAILALTMK